MRKTYSTPFWLIVQYRTGGMEVLRTILASGEETLPVFSFEDEARMFLELGTSGGWRVRETTAGELTSVLFGHCTGVDRIVLDPLPGSFAEPLMDLVSMGRKAFMESYLKDEETAHCWPPVPGIVAGKATRSREGQRLKGCNRDVEQVVQWR